MHGEWSPGDDGGGSPARRPMVELPPLGWGIVLAAVGVLVAPLTRVAGVAPQPVVLAAGCTWAAMALAALVPASLLHRVPAAPRTHPMLLAGLLCGAAVEWLHAIGTALAPALLTSAPSLWSLLPDLAVPLEIASPLLITLGLLRLRASGPTRPGLLGLLAVLNLGLLLAPLAIVSAWSHRPPDPGTDALQAILAVAAAGATWVPLAAWLDREPQRAFWGLLALAVPLAIVAGLVGLGELATQVAGPPGRPTPEGLFLGTSIAQAVLGALASGCAILAYARYTPEPRARPDPAP